MQVLEIAQPTKVHPGTLARVLRLLATNHIFKEVSPDAFANNRLLSVLDTGKSVEELLAKLVLRAIYYESRCKDYPESRHIGTLGITSFMGHVVTCFYSLDEGFKSSSYLTETLLDLELGHAYESNKTAFNNVKEDMWSWLELPDKLRISRFGAAMNDLKNASPDNAILEGYNWERLPEGSLVVDTGGSVGAQSLTLAKHHPLLRFIIQDRESVVGDAIDCWKKHMPDALESGRVEIQGYNFFDPQPARHNDDNSEGVTAFLTGDVVRLRRTCDETPGAELPVPPQPLLRDIGRAASVAYAIDLLMAGVFTERTITHLRDLLNQAGWKLTAVHYDKPSEKQISIAVPI
ncbi:hypothetical protein DFH94DRAFT_684737 [Russula ochroleuca]|uniref:O-methyltransferase n=1 Tax=Russula ochroleuca TaxID=152965 RepID=A0A9P5JZ98_9AGAM|nr:hypothetical protein DFH94DRAFT_684737 [Russula ochroleuca]